MSEIRVELVAGRTPGKVHVTKHYDGETTTIDVPTGDLPLRMKFGPFDEDGMPIPDETEFAITPVYRDAW